MTITFNSNLWQFSLLLSTFKSAFSKQYLIGEILQNDFGPTFKICFEFDLLTLLLLGPNHKHHETLGDLGQHVLTECFRKKCIRSYHLGPNSPRVSHPTQVSPKVFSIVCLHPLQWPPCLLSSLLLRPLQSFGQAYCTQVSGPLHGLFCLPGILLLKY
jgi:hypothetical protein